MSIRLSLATRKRPYGIEAQVGLTEGGVYVEPIAGLTTTVEALSAAQDVLFSVDLTDYVQNDDKLWTVTFSSPRTRYIRAICFGTAVDVKVVGVPVIECPPTSIYPIPSAQCESPIDIIGDVDATQLQGRPIDPGAPDVGDALVWDGNWWTPIDLFEGYDLRRNVLLVGVQDGTNFTYTTPTNFSITPFSEVVKRNGLSLLEGASNDYVRSESGGAGTGYDTITFNFDAPLDWEILLIDYLFAP